MKAAQLIVGRLAFGPSFSMLLLYRKKIPHWWRNSPPPTGFYEMTRHYYKPCHHVTGDGALMIAEALWLPGDMFI